MKFQVNFTNNVKLVYDLDTTVKSLSNWAREIKRMNVSNLCPLNHKNSTNNTVLIEKRILQLYKLVDILNRELPGSIVKETITKENALEALNRMHVHFPDIYKMGVRGFLPMEEVASEYNDIIHWLKGEFRSNGSSNFKMFLDFNKGGTEYYSINNEDYTKFNPFTVFGELSLHYTHVGKHARELFTSADLTSTKEQFVPQHTHSASVVMWFTGTPGSMNNDVKETYISKWKDFYHQRGGKDFFGLDIDDPKIAFGYLKIGELTQVTVDEVALQFQTKEETEQVRQLLLENDILNFHVE